MIVLPPALTPSMKALVEKKTVLFNSTQVSMLRSAWSAYISDATLVSLLPHTNQSGSRIRCLDCSTTTTSSQLVSHWKLQQKLRWALEYITQTQDEYLAHTAFPRNSLKAFIHPLSVHQAQTSVIHTFVVETLAGICIHRCYNSFVFFMIHGSMLSCIGKTKQSDQQLGDL